MSNKNKHLKQNHTNQTQTKTVWLIICLLGVGIIRLLPHFANPLWTYGYDSGFYAFALKYASSLQLLSSVPGIVSGFSSPALLIVKWLPFSANVNLLLLIILSQIATAAALFYFSKNKSLLVAYFSIFFFAFSQIQTQVEFLFLIKTLVTLPFFILGFKFFEEKKWRLFILNSLLTLWLHRTTAIVFVLTIFGSIAVNWAYAKKWKNLIFGLFSLSTLVFVAYIAFSEQFFVLFNHASQDVVNGIFYQGHSLFLALWITIPLALLGSYYAIKEKILSILISLFLISSCWFIFQLPFYQRILIYLDLSLIILSAYFVGSYLKNKSSTTKISYIILLSCFLVFSLIKFINTSTPLIDKESLNAIANFTFPETTGFVLAIDANDAPWLLGNLNKETMSKIKLAAPGLFDDPLTKEQWEKIWQGDDSVHLFSHFPKPLYVYQRNYHLTSFESSQCLQQINTYWYKNICN